MKKKLVIMPDELFDAISALRRPGETMMAAIVRLLQAAIQNTGADNGKQSE